MKRFLLAAVLGAGVLSGVLGQTSLGMDGPQERYNTVVLDSFVKGSKFNWPEGLGPEVLKYRLSDPQEVRESGVLSLKIPTGKVWFVRSSQALTAAGELASVDLWSRSVSGQGVVLLILQDPLGLELVYTIRPPGDFWGRSGMDRFLGSRGSWKVLGLGFKNLSETEPWQVEISRLTMGVEIPPGPDGDEIQGGW